MTALLERFAKAASTTTFRLSAAAVVFFVLAAAVIGALLFSQTNALLAEQTLSSLAAEGRALSQQSHRQGREAIIATVSALSMPEGPALYFLTDGSGAKLAGNLNRVPPEIAGQSQGGVFDYRSPREAGGGEHLAVAIPVDLASGLKLLVGRDIEDQRRFADRMKWIFLIGFGALSALGLIGGLAVSRLILTRMDQITATSRSIMDGDLTRRIPVDGDGGELDGLARNLNTMLDRIENLMNGLREVSDNIAHDLKTPLSRLRNAAEAALRDSTNAAGYREGLEQTIEKADELIKTFNALLLIARLEAGPLEESLETFDLGSMVQDVAELYTPAAEEAGFHLAIVTERGVTVHANRQLISQAVANLIDNAIKYSRGGGPGNAITVRAGREGPRAVLSVGDHGPGISPADRARVLKRFVRLEASRTAPGTGLGLSLVAAVARLHNGDVRLEDNDPGLKVTLVLSERCVTAPAVQTDDTAQAVAAQ